MNDLVYAQPFGLLRAAFALCVFIFCNCVCKRFNVPENA